MPKIKKYSTAKRLSRKKHFSGYCFDVVIDKVVWPNHTRLDRDLILHGGISVIVPCIDDNHIVLIHQYRYGADKMLWEVPAGTIAKGETPLACAKREIQEEIGYKASKWKKLAVVYASPGYNTEIINCFEAKGLNRVPIALEHDEIINPRIFTKKQVKRLIKTGKIVDAKSLISLFYYFMD